MFSSTARRSIYFAIIVGILIPLLLVPPVPVRSAESLASRPRYHLDVTLNFSTGSLSARESLYYTNTSDEPLRELVLNFTAARKGALSLVAATIDGLPVEPTVDGVVLALPLSPPLAPGAETKATVDFGGTVPSPGDLRFGRANGVVALGNWYPTVSAYRSGQGWDRHRYVDIGDAFLTPTADYEVNLSVSGTTGNVTVAHGGSLVGSSGNSWQVRADNVRDFAMALSDRYQTLRADVDGTRVSAFYLPGHADGGAIYLRAATESLRWYNRLIGAYPYPQLTIAETTGNDPGWVGQEYPTIILMGSTATASADDYLAYVVAHEVAHQWFYGLVGNDQLYEPWLDEAFATYLSYEYMRRDYPQGYAARWPAQRARFQNARASVGYLPVDSSIYEFASENHYYAMVYSQGALFLAELRQTLGEEVLYGLLRDFVDRYRYKQATGRDFAEMAELRSGSDLRALFGRYFSADLFASDLDWAVPAGHFYMQANGLAQGGTRQGYGVTNLDGVPFWDEFRRLGGVAGLGYPASRRFLWDGFVSQVFQKGVLQWRPEMRTASLVNVFDQMSRVGKDTWLETVRSTPPAADWQSDDGKVWPEVVRRHQRLLDDYPAIKQAYFAVKDPSTLYGLPMAPVQDMGDAYVLRAQRVVIQQWKVNRPWARAGEVTLANGGDVAKEAGLIAEAALRLEGPWD